MHPSHFSSAGPELELDGVWSLGPTSPHDPTAPIRLENRGGVRGFVDPSGYSTTNRLQQNGSLIGGGPLGWLDRVSETGCGEELREVE